MLAAVIVEGFAIALLTLLVVGLLRSHAEILRSLHDLGAGLQPDAAGAGSRHHAVHGARIDTLPASETAHDVAGERLDGESVAIAVVGTPHDTLLVFLSSGCLSCRPFWDELRAGDVGPATVRIVVAAQDEDNRRALSELAGDMTYDVLRSSAAWSDYAVPGSPHAVLVHGPTGRVVGEGTGQSLRQVVDLLSHAGDGAMVSSQVDARDNAERIDQELAASGIGMGHHSLHPGAVQGG